MADDTTDIPEMDPERAKPTNPRGRKENLAQYNGKQHQFTKEDHSKGGKVAAKKRKEQKMFADIIKQVLDMKLYSEEDVAELDSFEGLNQIDRNTNLTVMDALVLAQIKKASKGDKNAFCLIRDMIGQQPTQKVEVSSNIPIFINDMPMDDDYETTRIFSGNPQPEPSKKKPTSKKKTPQKDQSE